jgi:hypothetical protein
MPPPVRPLRRELGNPPPTDLAADLLGHASPARGLDLHP